MKHYKIYDNNSSAVTLFFCGWAMDHNPFKHLKHPTNDIVLLYDYTHLNFPSHILNSYTSCSIVAWSMGVWAASVSAKEISSIVPINEAIAINGTPYPISDTKGIPVKVFELTLSTLSPSSFDKFLSRICRNPQDEIGSDCRPQRDIHNIREELESIPSSMLKPALNHIWSHAIIGERDTIFPPSNQQEAWRDICPVTKMDISHYSAIIGKIVDGTFEKLVDGTYGQEGNR